MSIVVVRANGPGLSCWVVKSVPVCHERVRLSIRYCGIGGPDSCGLGTPEIVSRADCREVPRMIITDRSRTVSRPSAKPPPYAARDWSGLRRSGVVGVIRPVCRARMVLDCDRPPDARPG